MKLAVAAAASTAVVSVIFGQSFGANTQAVGQRTTMGSSYAGLKNTTSGNMTVTFEGSLSNSGNPVSSLQVSLSNVQARSISNGNAAAVTVNGSTVTLPPGVELSGAQIQSVGTFMTAPSPGSWIVSGLRALFGSGAQSTSIQNRE